jgi:hypothetical protein
MGLVRHAIRISKPEQAIGKHEMMTALLHHQLTVSCPGLNPERQSVNRYGKKQQRNAIS